MGTIASLLARTGAAVEQLNAKHHWLRYVFLFGMCFAWYGNVLRLIDGCATAIYMYALALLYFWTIPKQERQLYNFTVPKKKMIALAFIVGIICYAASVTFNYFFNDNFIKLQDPISIAVGFPIVFVFMFILVLSEEILFRGILWGEGRRINLSNFSILCIQAILFFAAHSFWVNYSPLWIQVLVSGLICGIVAWKTKSVLASAIVLACINCTGEAFVHALVN
ncbi:MAG: CPBP family intramembrane metalloprotease [Holophagales bacterium]|jgi:membrane protease YdiL (CAAX protease family)|nr:CPBP family intramembrane metalloprotease [Holophagales bacterium]